MSENDPARIWLEPAPTSADMRPANRVWTDDPAAFGGEDGLVGYVRVDIATAHFHSQQQMILALEDEIAALTEKLDELTYEVVP